MDLSGFLKAISSAPDGSVFLLHACAHNPTGLDPNQSQWDEILAALEKRSISSFLTLHIKVLPVEIWKRCLSIRKAIDSKVITSPIIICQSFAKNVGMYGERVGAIHVIPSTVESNDSLNRAIKSQLNRIIRSELSNPPAYGSKIVATILNDPELYSQWRKDLVTMSSRSGEMKIH